MCWDVFFGMRMGLVMLVLPLMGVVIIRVKLVSSRLEGSGNVSRESIIS